MNERGEEVEVCRAMKQEGFKGRIILGDATLVNRTDVLLSERKIVQNGLDRGPAAVPAQISVVFKETISYRCILEAILPPKSVNRVGMVQPPVNELQ